MRIIPASIPDVKRIVPDVFHDDRGSFSVTFSLNAFESAGLPTAFAQHNHSHSRRGVLRGLHYQIRQAQGKLLHVVRGTIYDVSADIRRGSKYFGQWTGQTLRAEEEGVLWIPPGFAHGFYVLSDSADIIYYVTDHYSPRDERTIAWNDSDLAIDWPIPAGEPPILSDKDRQGVPFAEADMYDGRET
ncbi:MAG: dTDP-4-dehydrorhamnose 3,5-epimerase [Rhodothermia bacterium]|nr:dTDP-4-dehydrorhamnose 3,5-epimerase [Rhodothermia bacterium]